MSNHLRYSGSDAAAQRRALEQILRANPVVWRALEAARVLALPDWRIVSGAIYNTVWNALTGRPSAYGIKDIDLFYFDASDISWEAEDCVIRRANQVAPSDPPLEIRNQARVHLWYERHFGHPIAPLISTDQSIGRFAALTHCVGVRLAPDGKLDINAPYGLEPVFAFRLEPNPLNDCTATYAEKAERAKRLWPELSVEPWRNEEIA